MVCVARRLDARYDWLPSPDVLAKYGHLLVVYVGNACSPNTFVNRAAGHLALVSNETGNCSYFTKVRNFIGNFYSLHPGENKINWDFNSIDLFFKHMQEIQCANHRQIRQNFHSFLIKSVPYFCHSLCWKSVMFYYFSKSDLKTFKFPEAEFDVRKCAVLGSVGAPAKQTMLRTNFSVY